MMERPQNVTEKKPTRFREGSSGNNETDDDEEEGTVYQFILI